jgi:hypothetical protein
LLSFALFIPSAIADDLGSSVTIGNATPAFTAGPAENPSSHSGTGLGGTAGNPTNVGSNATWQATATDSNGDNYYLAVCHTNAITAHNSAAPTCATDEDNCVSTSTASGAQASCNMEVSVDTPESDAWYAFVCDHNAASVCSSASQGTGDSGSPIYVNHAPAFTVYSNDGPRVPGTTPIAHTTTSSDADTADTVQLFVCATAGFTGGATPACTGTQVCASSAGASNPTCNRAITVPTQDASHDDYGYIVDNHGLVSGGIKQGTISAAVISNVAPVVTSVALTDTDGSGDMTLTTEEGETTGFKVTFTVTDNNSCLTSASGNEITANATQIYVYRSVVAQAGCDVTGEHDADYCYSEENGASWTSTCTQDGGTCSGASDTDVTFTCTFPMQYHADPTVTNSTKAAENWLASVIVTDDDSAASNKVESSSGTEMGMFMSYNVTDATVAYGSLSPGNDSSVATTTVEATGNVGLDANVSGTDMTASALTIDDGQQKYSLTSETWTNADYTLDGTPTERELNCLKTTTTATPASAALYWILRVPSTQAAGSYTGTNTIAGVTGESASWQ